MLTEMKRIDFTEKLRDVRLRSFLACLEDELIMKFDYSRRESYAYLEEKGRMVEAFYDFDSGKLEVIVFGEGDRHPYPNVEELIRETISTERIINEVNYNDDILGLEYEMEMDTRDHLDRLHYGNCRHAAW